MSNKLGFIGCGEMAGAIIKGILKSGMFASSDINASVKTGKSASTKSKHLKIKVLADNDYVSKNSEVLFIATKPNQVDEVLNEIGNNADNKLVISIASGISTMHIEEKLQKSRVIRVMPNTPSMIGEGISGICRGKLATDEDEKFVVELFTSVGHVIIVDEERMDVVTALSGSGPAFFYQIFDDMAKSGEKLGLDYEKSLKLVLQTAIGAAKLANMSEVPLSELIQSVSTPGGCTEVGIKEMHNLKSIDLFSNVIEKTALKTHSHG